MSRDTHEIAEGWGDRIAAAQADTHVVIAENSYPRRAWGPDHPQHAITTQPCRDCGVKPGQLHVWTCMMERCPVCGGQAYGCECLLDAEFGTE